MAAAPRVAATGRDAKATAVLDRDAAAPEAVASAGAAPPDDPAASGPGEDAEAEVASAMGRSPLASRKPCLGAFNPFGSSRAGLRLDAGRFSIGRLHDLGWSARTALRRDGAIACGLPVGKLGSRRLLGSKLGCHPRLAAFCAGGRRLVAIFWASTAAPGLAARLRGGLCPGSRGRHASGLGAAGRLARGFRSGTGDAFARRASRPLPRARVFLAGGRAALRTRGRGRGRRLPYGASGPALAGRGFGGPCARCGLARRLPCRGRLRVGVAPASSAPLGRRRGDTLRRGRPSRALAVPAPRPGSGALRPFTPPVASPVSVLARVSSPAPLPELFFFPVATPLAACGAFSSAGVLAMSSPRLIGATVPTALPCAKAAVLEQEQRTGRAPVPGCRLPRGPTAQLGNRPALDAFICLGRPPRLAGRSATTSRMSQETSARTC